MEMFKTELALWGTMTIIAFLQGQLLCKTWKLSTNIALRHYKTLEQNYCEKFPFLNGIPQYR